MKKTFILIVLLLVCSGCLQSLTIGVYNRIEIQDNDSVETKTGNISDTSLKVGTLP